MLESISLQNYKAFEDTGEIKIKPVTLLLGKNNSGKSSILKALSFIREGLSKGLESQLSLTPVEGLRMGDTLLDIFHRRLFTELIISTQFTENYIYKIFLLSKNGDVLPYQWVMLQGDKIIADGKGSNLKSNFAGLNPLSLEPKYKHIFDFKVYHLGPLRIMAPSIMPRNKAISKDFVGYNGEYTYGILLDSYLKDSNLWKLVSEWFKENIEGIELNFEPIDASGSNFRLNVIKDKIAINIADAGFGISQVLPVITQTFFSGSDTIICIEQPVLHLHPASHANVAKRIAESSISNGTRYVIESHSKNFLLALRLEAIDPHRDFKRSDASIYYIEGEEGPAIITEITINPDGSLSSWPTGVFGEDADLLERIIDLR